MSSSMKELLIFGEACTLNAIHVYSAGVLFVMFAFTMIRGTVFIVTLSCWSMTVKPVKVKIS